ncbi:MAG TPA: helix-turn-helix transcriptional regulator [Phycisphaerae bacterium]|nr:helix-turn-helix transcriptional regulator [Phycisphaerae bacterium]
MAFQTFGEAFKSHRLRLQMSLRKFCEANGLEPGNISKLERDLLPPPKAERLYAYARALGLLEGSDEWYEFCDLAAAVRGEFPEDLRDQELISQLPALFRTMRGDPPSDEQLVHVVKLLRKR